MMTTYLGPDSRVGGRRKRTLRTTAPRVSLSLVCELPVPTVSVPVSIARRSAACISGVWYSIKNRMKREISVLLYTPDGPMKAITSVSSSTDRMTASASVSRSVAVVGNGSSVLRPPSAAAARTMRSNVTIMTVRITAVSSASSSSLPLSLSPLSPPSRSLSPLSGFASSPSSSSTSSPSPPASPPPSLPSPAAPSAPPGFVVSILFAARVT
mmetsp:Transcript_24623/g.85643  ORF Transcript_24623/g.85643 Transcript_24623/m.85643 type:complete len:212 (+) Transcript_24623:1555-2190(+)